MRAQGKEETEVLVTESLPDYLPVLHEVLLCSLISHSPWSSHEDDNYGILITEGGLERALHRLLRLLSLELLFQLDSYSFLDFVILSHFDRFL